MIDFHCHLDLYSDPWSVANECATREMYVLSVTTTPLAWHKTKELGGKRTRTALGLHPQLAHLRSAELTLFQELLPDVRYVGEVGLDGTPKYRSHWREQITVFRRILRLCADAGGRILSIHSRRAAESVLDCLEECPDAGIPILHWFSGSVRELERAIDLGCWFSVGPTMLMGQRGKILVSRIPTDRLLTESDGPFATIRGKPMLPWDVDVAVPSLIDLWGTDRDGVLDIVHENLRFLGSRLPWICEH